MKLKVKETFAKLLDTTPVGKIVMYAGGSAPRGWLLCQGQAVSRTTYAKLFSVIGTTYGSGDGSTTFNIPNMKGRFPLGCGEPTSNTAHAWGDNLTYNGVNIYNEALGNRGGESMHTLDINQMPSHRHYIREEYGTAPSSSYPPNATYSMIAGDSAGTKSWQNAPISDTGGGQAHNNMPPYSAVNFLIYVGG